MASTSGGDPGGSFGRTLPVFMDPRNEFGALTTLLMTGKNGKALPLEPFIIGKSIEDLIGPIEDAVSEDKASKYVLRTRKPAQVEKLLTMTELVDGTEVEVVLHPKLNISRCVISSVDLLEKGEDELEKQLGNQGVIKAKRIMRNKENTAAIVLTFNRAVYPKDVKVGVLRVQTRPYYPNPMLCFNCFEYGHPSRICQNPKRCFNCSQTHEERDCEAAAFCRNCEKDHRPSNRQCPIYKLENDIIRTKIDFNITFAEARKRVAAGNGSYAQVAAQPRLDRIKLNALNAQIAEQRMTIEKLEKALQNKQEMDGKINEVLEQNKEKERQINALLEHLKQRDEKIAKIEASNLNMRRYIDSMHSRVRSDSQTSEPAAETGSNKKKKSKRSTHNSQERSKSNMSPPPKKQLNINRSPIMTRQMSSQAAENSAVVLSGEISTMDFEDFPASNHGPSDPKHSNVTKQ